MKLSRRFGNWLGNKLALFLLGDGLPDEPPDLPAVERLDEAPPDSPLLGSEAAAMLASSTARLVPVAAQPLPLLEGSVEERRARLRGL